MRVTFLASLAVMLLACQLPGAPEDESDQASPSSATRIDLRGGRHTASRNPRVTRRQSRKITSDADVPPSDGLKKVKSERNVTPFHFFTFHSSRLPGSKHARRRVRIALGEPRRPERVHVEGRRPAVGDDLGEQLAQRRRVHHAVAGGAVHQEEIRAAGRGAENGVLVGRHLVESRPAGRRIDLGTPQHRHPPVRLSRHLPRPTRDPPRRRTDGPRRPASARAGARGRRAPGGGIRRPRRSSSASSREAGRRARWPRPGV